MTTTSSYTLTVPFFRPSIGEEEIARVVECLRSGWLTSGPQCQSFEREFAAFVGAEYAVAVNSCTAALHLAVEAFGLRRGDAVLVPTMTFTATAAVVAQQGGVPILVDCDARSLNMDLADAEEKRKLALRGELAGCGPLRVVGIIPVHVGGEMLDMGRVGEFARRHGLWVVEDGAHALPAAYRETETGRWRQCGEGTADVSCFSFYANKTITTGEGGMAVSPHEHLARRMRQMALHGMSHDGWNRHAKDAPWDYRVEQSGFKYNLCEFAAALCRGQLSRAEEFRSQREAIAVAYRRALADVAELELPALPDACRHAWHLFAIKLNPDRLAVTRNQFMTDLKSRGVGCSVHWRPLHLHPFYQQTYAWNVEQFPVASRRWEQLLSLPLFPGMEEGEVQYVIETVRDLCREHSAGPIPPPPKPR